jgi:putative transposase
MPQRRHVEPTDDWHQIALLTREPGQRTYELIRPVVLFGQSPAERATETGLSARTVFRQVAQFEQLGMASFVPPPTREKHRLLPPEVRQAILDAKREHPPLNVHELTTICWARTGHRPSAHTVKRILAEQPPPPRTHRRFRPYHAESEPIRRRLAVVQLHVEGWTATSIAEYLETSRQTVYTILNRWAEEAFAGMPDKSRAPHRRGTKVTLRAIATVKELQENPLLGEFRVHAALKRLGIQLSPRTCGRILALNRKFYGLAKPAPAPREPKPMPFKAARRHQYWSADIRYIDHGLGDFRVYSVTILDNYSRAVVASGLSRTQDLSTFLMVFFMAVQQHGAPEGMVTDSGSIFRAKQLLAILDRLGVVKHEIERRQPWQNYIEANFGVQRRIADRDFAKAGTWPELLVVHDQWVTEHNYQDHFAHLDRPEERRSPAAVLHRVCGRLFSPEELHRIFYSTRFGRVLDRAGYARFRRWRVYAEQGLRGEPVAVWLYAEHLTLVYSDEPLAQYRVTYHPDKRRLHTVTPKQLFDTAHRSPQQPLWTRGEDEWLPVLRLPAYAPRHPRPTGGTQLSLFSLDELSA